MIPYVSEAIQALSQKMLTGILPQLQSTYVMSDTAMMAMLMNALAAEAESGIANRLQDMLDMRAIFQAAEEASALDVLPTFELDVTQPQTFELSSINRMHDEMTYALIELHSKVEGVSGYSDLNEKIWRYLSETHQRHALNI